MAYTTINKSSDYFNTKIWTGTGANLSITGVGHQPDFTWIKNRANTDDHNLFDVLRGFSTDSLLRSNTIGAATDTTEGIKSFDSDGFSLGTNGSSNGNGQGMVSWNWKAGTTGSGTTGGSGTAKAYSYSVNTTAGFSIVKYLGNSSAGHTIPHHLGATPKMIIAKSPELSQHWAIYHKDIGNTHYMEFDTTAKLDDAGVWNDTSPSSSVFTVGSSDKVNASNGDMIAYCFAEKTGYSKFGKYTGNGNADGTFVYTGFKPAFVMVKNTTDSSTNWCLFDNKRDTSNPNSIILLPNSNDADINASSINTDFLSNGFKLRNTDNDRNGSGDTHIYMAFAEAPLVGTNNVPCTAR